MKRIGLIAAREFLAAVMNRGFVIGLLIMPAIFVTMFTLGPRLFAPSTTPIRGEVAVVDSTGQVLGPLRTALDPAAITARREELARRAVQAVTGNDDGPPPPVSGRFAPPIPDFTLVPRPAPGDNAANRGWLTAGDAGARRLGVVVVDGNAVTPDAAGEYGTYALLLPPNLDERIESAIREGMREALIGARTSARGLERSSVEALMRVQPPSSITVNQNGEARPTVRGLNRALPFIFAGLLVFSVMIGGQTLLTSMVEEKSSRVVEVLLSAVSPFELMAGKLLGQMAVSFLVLAVYVSLGFLALFTATLAGLLDPLLVVYLVLFFVVTYLVFGSIMMAVGAAVNEMREAQSLLGPVMLVMWLPWLFVLPISREPNSTFATILSLVPPVNTFVMMTRLTSSAPPPVWQVGLTLLISIGAAAATLWFAAKVFKIGLLMHGKPPSLATLVRWAKAA